MASATSRSAPGASRPDAAGSIRSGRVIEVLSRLVSVHGSPALLCLGQTDAGVELFRQGLAAGFSRNRDSRFVPALVWLGEYDRIAGASDFTTDTMSPGA